MFLRNLSVRLIIAMLTFLLGVAAAWLISRAPEENLRVLVPNGRWVHILFEMQGLSTKPLDEVASEANLPALRNALLPKDDLEVRFWVVTDEFGRALILRRTAGKWSAVHIHGLGSSQPLRKLESQVAPKSGWEGAWGRLVDAGILTLPDAGEADCRVGGLDGVDYVVELNTNKTYRTYMYDNPDYAKCEEAKQMIKVVNIIDEEFMHQVPKVGQ